MKCPNCNKKMKNKSYLLWDLSGSPPNNEKPSLRWVDKFKCKRCGTKVKDGEVKIKDKTKFTGEISNEQSDNEQ